jgi:hypothetical protein
MPSNRIQHDLVSHRGAQQPVLVASGVAPAQPPYTQENQHPEYGEDDEPGRHVEDRVCSVSTHTPSEAAQKRIEESMPSMLRRAAGVRAGV